MNKLVDENRVRGEKKKAPRAYKELRRKSNILCKVLRWSLQSSPKQKTAYSHVEA